jgi:hypothetical protein
MKLKLLKASLFALAVYLGLLGGVWAVNQNPAPGSIWTWLGPTFGADWVSPVGAAGCVNIIAFGGVGNDITDNTPAWNAAKAVSKCISFPAGTFRFNTGISHAFTANLEGITVVGQGQDVTVLHFPSAVGTALTITKNQFSQSVHIRDLTMTTGTTNVDVGIRINQTRTFTSTIASGYSANDITRMTFRSDEGYWEEGAGTPLVITHGWKEALHITNDSVYDLIGVTVYGPTPPGGPGDDAYPTPGGNSGTAIIIDGISSTTIPVLFNLDRVNLNWLEKGLVAGTYAQGFQVAQSNFTGCYQGILVPAGAIGVTQLAVTASQFNNVKNIDVQSVVAVLTIANNLLYSSPRSGSVSLVMTAPSNATHITGNAFSGLGSISTSTGGTGVIINPSGPDILPPTIIGNSFYNLNTGINLSASATGTQISTNQFRNMIKNVVNEAPHRAGAPQTLGPSPPRPDPTRRSR